MTEIKTNQKLDDLIEKSKVSQNDLADKLHLTRQRVYELRKDPDIMSTIQMERMASILGVPFKVIHKIHKEARK